MPMPRSHTRIMLIDAPERQSLWFSGTIPSPALSILASYVKTRYDLRVLDLNVGARPWDTLREALARHRPHLVGLTCTHTCHINEVTACSRMIRKLSPDSIIVGGGIYFSVMAKSALDANLIDLAVIGEGERTFTELCAAVDSITAAGTRALSFQQLLADHAAAKALAAIPGLAWRTAAGALHYTAPRPYIEDLDTIPFPSYELYDIAQYRSPTFGGGDAFGMTFSRGCARRCAFCSESAGWNHTLRKHSPAYAVRHLEIIYRNFNRRVFVFGDTDFLVDRDWCLDFISLITSKSIDINFHIQASCNSVIANEDLLPKLRDIGLFEVMIGAESPFRKVLERLNKPYHERETVERAMAAVKRHGLLLMAMLVWGGEHDDAQTLRDGLDFFDKYADIVCPCALTPYPGTALYDEMKAKNLVNVDDFAFYDQSHVILPAGNMSYRETRRVYEAELCRYFNLNPKFYAKLFTKDHFLKMNHNAFFKMVWARTLECVTTQGGYRAELYKNDEYLKIMNS